MEEISAPPKRIAPAQTRSCPIRQRINVDLPTPLRPMTATISPTRTFKSIPCRIGELPYPVRRPVSSSSVSDGIVANAEIDRLHVFVGGDLVDRAFGEQLAEMQDGHLFGNLAHKRHVVLDHQDR